MTTTGFPYTRTQLEQDALAELGHLPFDTFSTLCSLYERGLISYPRTDCKYLPLSLYPQAQKMIKQIMLASHNSARLSTGAKSDAWNDELVTAHHGIIPTDVAAVALIDADLSEIEMDVYRMVRKAFVSMFRAVAPKLEPQPRMGINP